MTKLFLAASVAAIAIAAPAAAERGGKQGGQRAESAQADRGGGRASAARVERRGGSETRAARTDRRSGEARQMRFAQRDERRAQRVERASGDRSVQRQESRSGRAMQRVDRSQVRNERSGNRIDRQEARAQRSATRVDRQEARPQRSATRIERQEARTQRVDRQKMRAQRQAARVDRQEMRAQRVDDRILQREQRMADRIDRREARLDGALFTPSLSNNGRRASWVNGCPPGLTRVDGSCMPFGQYKKMMTGQVLPAAYSNSLMPLALRDLYRDDDDHYYRYGNGYAYRVNRDTNLIAALLPLLGGGYSVGQMFPSSYMNNYVPDYYRAFYPDTSDDYYRYANGYIYEIDAGSGMIEDIVPAYGYGYGVGDMMPASYSYYNVPYQYRDMYYDSDDYYYRYAPGAIYQVDRQSSLITAIASLLSPNLGIGQQLPMGYDVYNVPYQYRSQYYDTPNSWYRYSNGNIYQVDPTTRLITAVIDAIV
jgi:hypothetical protein